MKTLILILCVLLPSFVMSGEQIYYPPEKMGVKVKEICVNNLAYVLTISSRGYNSNVPNAIVQVYERDSDRRNPPQPKRCP